MEKKKVKLKGPRYISEMLSYRCPFTDEVKLMHPIKWQTYVRDKMKGKTFDELVLAYRSVEDRQTEELIEKAMLNYHNSTEH